jgi:SAM-dependent methyltransferase
MLEHIAANENFRGASVLDLGCGYGDLLLGSAFAGAVDITGVDQNLYCLDIARRKIAKLMPTGVRFRFLFMDIDIRSVLGNSLSWYDIAFCTSVLPYLENREMVLSFLSARSSTTFVEMQYYGDGPGPADIKNDNDMRDMLCKHWSEVEKIGETRTGRTPPTRSIWKCSVGVDSWLRPPHPNAQ